MAGKLVKPIISPRNPAGNNSAEKLGESAENSVDRVRGAHAARARFGFIFSADFFVLNSPAFGLTRN